MRHAAILAWTQLYAGVGLLAAICAGCAIIKTICDIRSGALAPPSATLGQKAVYLPLIWLHFQLSYYCGFPCIMAIAVFYAYHIGFAAFDPS